MPDGDEVRSKLERKFQRVYKHVCAGDLPEDDLAYEVVTPTKKKIEEYGDEAIQLIAAIAQEIAKTQTDLPLFQDQVDWVVLKRHIERISQEINMDKRAKHLILRASQDQIKALQNGERSHNQHIDLIHRYFWQVYRCDFEAFVFSGLDHMHRVSPATVRLRLQQMKHQVLEKLEPLAEQAYRLGTIKMLKMPGRYPSKKTGVSLDTDLLTI